MNKKGMDISLNFVILAVLALLALILVALFLTGGLSNLFATTEEVGGTSEEQVSFYKAKCELYCSLDNKDAWDEPSFPEDLEYKDSKVTSCEVFDLSYTWNEEDECIEE